jgi:predicted AAA+ superfamily ATPase
VIKSDSKETKLMILKNIYDTYLLRDIVELLRISDLDAFKTPKITRSYMNFIKEYRPARGFVLTADFWGKLKINNTLILFVPIYFI